MQTPVLHFSSSFSSCRSRQNQGGMNESWRESPQVSRGVFLLWKIPFNALDSGLRDFLFGPLKSAQFRFQLDFPKLRPTGRTRCVLSWRISSSAVETSVVGRILCGSHRIAYGPYESRSDPVFRPFSCKITNKA